MKRKIKTACIIIWVIYLSGCVTCYFVHRWEIKSWGYGYTVSDRHAGMVLSVGSWAFVAATFLYHLTNNRDDTPAKW